MVFMGLFFYVQMNVHQMRHNQYKSKKRKRKT